MIFLLSAVIWAFLHLNGNVKFLSGLLLIGIVSFIDDVISLSARSRFIAQTIAVVVLCSSLGILSNNSITIAVAIILIMGWINAFNFMDGINGITALYTFSMLVPMIYAINFYELPYSTLIVFILLSLSVFMFLNLRVKALAFSGDVGSVVLAYIIAYLIVSLVIESQHIEFILFGSVYGVDSVITIIRRLFKKENIFVAHRMHLYQLLSNELEWHFLSVSLVYSFTQMVVNSILLYFIIYQPSKAGYVGISEILILLIMYLIGLFLVQKRRDTILQRNS